MKARCYCTTLPPRVVQLTTSVVAVQPWPLQAFWPLQAELALLQALVPLHEFTPVHFTEPEGWVWADAAKVPAAKIAAAVATRVFLDMFLSQNGNCGPTMTPAPAKVKSG